MCILGLSALSYKLHADLAAQHGGEKWGYRTVDTLVSTLFPPLNPTFSERTPD